MILKIVLMYLIMDKMSRIKFRKKSKHFSWNFNKTNFLDFSVSLEELKQDVSSFRYEILNNLKSHDKDYKKELTTMKEQQQIIKEKLDNLLSSIDISKPHATKYVTYDEVISKL